MRIINALCQLVAYLAFGLLILAFFGGISAALIGQAATIGGIIAALLITFALAFGAVGAALVLFMASETADQLTRKDA